MRNRILLTLGDPNGVGPELLLKTLVTSKDSGTQFILIGPKSVFDYYAKRMNIQLDIPSIGSVDDIPMQGNVILDQFDFAFEPHPGKISTKAGQISMMALEHAMELTSTGAANALVTAPISKESIHMAGYSFPGHTEFLAERTNCHDYTMMLVSGGLRVGLLTSHIPLRIVPKMITEESIIRKATIIRNSLINDFSISKPKIAVLGLNPHAGDGGVLGSEENEIIEPAIMFLKQQMTIEGPFAADGWFGNQQFDEFDAVLAMYHDQGLAPFKAISFGRGVNFTAGLPIIRTSPDHGTAFGIAGKNIAKTDSMNEAIKLAVQLNNKRSVQ